MNETLMLEDSTGIKPVSMSVRPSVRMYVCPNQRNLVCR